MSLSDAMGAVFGLPLEVPETQRRAVAWANASKVPGDLFDEWRLTLEGRYINWYEYGQYSKYGWHIDHRLPKRLGGRDTADNLVARHWYDNVRDGGLLAALLNWRS